MGCSDHYLFLTLFVKLFVTLTFTLFVTVNHYSHFTSFPYLYIGKSKADEEQYVRGTVCETPFVKKFVAPVSRWTELPEYGDGLATLVIYNQQQAEYTKYTSPNGIRTRWNLDNNHLW